MTRLRAAWPRSGRQWAHDAVVAALASVAAVAGCASAPTRPPGTPLKEAPTAAQAAGTAAPAADPKVAAGGELFKTKGCVMCHGDGGKGGFPNRYSLSELVPALDKVAEGYTEDELKSKIKKGVPSVAKKNPEGHVAILIMPSWEDKLSEEEIGHIVAYLFSLAPKKEGGEKDDF